jgi:nicotinate-nucleotide adenylyltransferase
MICAQEAHTQLGLDVVVFVPVGIAPHREIAGDPGGEVRFTLCEHATSHDARFSVSRIELDRAGPSYTVDTLRDLHRRSPDDELFLILGGDQAAALRAWHAADDVLALATIAVGERPGHDRTAILEAVGSDDLVFFEMPQIDISSTMVRARAAAGRPIRYLVPDKVANYVGAQSLYGSSVGVGS